MENVRNSYLLKQRLANPKKSNLIVFDLFQHSYRILLFLMLCVVMTSCHSGLEQGDRRPPAPLNATSECAWEKRSLRTIPAMLSAEEMESLIKRHNFYESRLNPEGQSLNVYQNMTLTSDPVVVDCAYDLMWSSGLVVRSSFHDAQEVIATLHYAGFNDWRLPTVEELASLLQPRREGGFYPQVFGQFHSDTVWSADAVLEESNGRAWYVDFARGRIQAFPTTEFFSLLLVRTLHKLPIDSRTGASVRGLGKDW